MKLLDLINKKAKNELLPRYICLNGKVYIYDFDLKNYKDNKENILEIDFSTDLNQEVNVLKNYTEIDKIEDFKIDIISYVGNTLKDIDTDMKIERKINELIKAVKFLNEKTEKY